MFLCNIRVLNLYKVQTPNFFVGLITKTGEGGVYGLAGETGGKETTGET